MNRLSLVQALAPANWPTLVMVSARIVGLMLVAPLWSMAGVPRSARSAMVVVFTLALLPGVAGFEAPADHHGLILPVASELTLGLAIGMVGAVFMAGVAMAGEVAALQMGLNLGPALAPMAEGSVSGVGELKNLLALTLYVTLGGHLVLLHGVAQSFHAVPPGGLLAWESGLTLAGRLGGAIFVTAVRVAAPVMVALLLANLALAILSKAVPQLNAMAVAFPVTIGLGLLVLGAALPFTGAFIGGWVDGLSSATAATVGPLVPAGAP